MKTADEILENWAEEQHGDWYAIDRYLNGEVLRLYVGREEDAKRRAADYVTGLNLVDDAGEPAEPGWNGEWNTPYYRCLIIHQDEARAYFDGIMEELSADWITHGVAASMLGVSRGRISQLATRGQIGALGNLVSRADVEQRMKGVRNGRPKKA